TVTMYMCREMCSTLISLLSLLSIVNSVNCGYIFSYMLHNPIASEPTSMESSESIHQAALVDLALNDQQDNSTSKIRCNSDTDCSNNNNNSDIQMYCGKLTIVSSSSTVNLPQYI